MKIEWGSQEWKAEVEKLHNRIDELEQGIEQMEAQLLERLAAAEKLARAHGSLSTEKPEEPTAIGGYVPWSQRKARRVMKAASAGFTQRVLKNAQRGTAATVGSTSSGESAGS